MKAIGETICTGSGLRYGKRWFNDLALRFWQPVGSTMYWHCGHVTDHGSVEHPSRCPICSCDRLRICCDQVVDA